MSSLVSVTSTSKTARAHPDDSSSVSFAASFLRGETVGHVWSEYVQTLPLDYDPPWAEFSKVLWDDLGNEKTFVDKTWESSLVLFSALETTYARLAYSFNNCAPFFRSMTFISPASPT